MIAVSVTNTGGVAIGLLGLFVLAAFFPVMWFMERYERRDDPPCRSDEHMWKEVPYRGRNQVGSHTKKQKCLRCKQYAFTSTIRLQIPDRPIELTMSTSLRPLSVEDVPPSSAHFFMEDGKLYQSLPVKKGRK